MAGVPADTDARLLGDTVDMVERVYGKHSPDFLREAADALAGRRFCANDSETITPVEGSRRGQTTKIPVDKSS